MDKPSKSMGNDVCHLYVPNMYTTSMLGSVRHDLMFRISIAVMLVSRVMVDSSQVAFRVQKFLNMNKPSK